MAQVEQGEVPEPDDGADGLVYVALQELATRIAHRTTGKLLDDQAGYEVMARVAGDENLHHLFYRDLVTAALELDPSGDGQAIERQVREFEMPGTGIPDFDAHAMAIANAGIYDLQSTTTRSSSPSSCATGTSRSSRASRRRPRRPARRCVKRIERIGRRPGTSPSAGHAGRIRTRVRPLLRRPRFLPRPSRRATFREVDQHERVAERVGDHGDPTDGDVERVDQHDAAHRRRRSSPPPSSADSTSQFGSYPSLVDSTISVPPSGMPTAA